MLIKKFEPTSTGLCKVTPDSGAIFYIRKEYLVELNFDSVFAGAEFNEEETSELLDAGLAAVVELKAITYLARCEQCRFNLTNKLVQKGFQKKYINQALDFLESKKLLSDSRFATAWLNGRRLNHYEGRTKLAAELAARGIGREVAEEALDEFFTENDEEEICRKAYEKLSRSKSGEKLTAALVKAGFSYKRVKCIINERGTTPEN
jgi:regulatory protein